MPKLDRQLVLEFNAAKRRIGFLQTIHQQHRATLREVWDLWVVYDVKKREEAVQRLRAVLPESDVVQVLEAFNRTWVE